MENKEPQKIIWHDMYLIRISDVPGFREWLWGQTCPLVDDDPDPLDWAYFDDYERYINGLPIID